jgi:hypothetical protein
MAEKTKQENRADFKKILEAGGPRAAVAAEVVNTISRYLELCGELNRRAESPAAPLIQETTEAIQAHAEELDGFMGRLYAIVRDWEELQAETAVTVVVNVLCDVVPGAEAAR